MTTFTEAVAAEEQRRIADEVRGYVDVLDRTLDEIVYSSMLSAEQKAEAARASFAQFVAVVNPKLEAMPAGETVGETAVEKRDVRRKFTAVVEKANRLMGSASPVAGATVSTISKTRADVDDELSKLAEERAASTGSTVEIAYRDILRSPIGKRLRSEYLDAPSAPVEKTVDVGADRHGAAFSEIEKLAVEHASRHGVSHAVAVRDVSKRRRDLVAKHRAEMAEMQAS